MYIGFNNNILNHKDFPPELWEHIANTPPLFYYELFVAQSIIPLWDYHKDYFFLAADKLNLLLPDFFVAYDKFLTRLVNRNKFFNGAVVKVIFYPWQDEFMFIAIPKKVDYKRFMVNDDKFIAIEAVEYNCFNDYKFNFLWTVDLHNYIYNKNAKVVVINDKLFSISQLSVLAINDNTVFSPTFHSGSKYNALQVFVNKELIKLGYVVKDQSIDINFIEQAEQVWLIDNTYGIYNRIGWKQNRYYIKNLANKLIDKLNAKYF